MDDHNPPIHEATPMLWLLVLLLAWLAGHLTLAYTRDAQRSRGPAATALDGAAAALALGSALFAAMAMAVASQAVAYPVGFRADALAASWAVAVVASAVPVALMNWRPSVAPALLGALAFGSGATVAQAGVLWATGLLPGLVWHPATLVGAAVLQALLTAGALWLAFLGPGRSGRHRRRWRAAAAVVLAVSLLLGPELVLMAGDMATQVASSHTGRVSRWEIKLLAAVAVPSFLVLLAAALYLRGDHVAAAAGSPPGRRRRRRRRWWAFRP